MTATPIDFLRQFFTDLKNMHREKLVSLTALETEELENIFALLLFGSFIGIPAPPTFLAVELIPFMEKELTVLNRRAKDCTDMFAEMCGTLGID